MKRKSKRTKQRNVAGQEPVSPREKEPVKLGGVLVETS